MSLYQKLNPVFAHSVMHVFKIENSLRFSNTITYDYLDSQGKGNENNYYNFLKITDNFNQELELYWDNLQNFLDEEINLLNGKEADQTVKHCNIYFRTKIQPFVQWVVNFEGDYHSGINIYENEVEPESLTYPIYSLYIFHAPLNIVDIESSMQYNVDKKQGFIEYYGETGDVLEGKEEIRFTAEF